MADPLIVGIGCERFTQALTILVGAGHLQPTLPADNDVERKKRTTVFNAALMEPAKHSVDLCFSASPITGGGVPVNQIEKFVLLATGGRLPVSTKTDSTKVVWDEFSRNSQRLRNNGKVLKNSEENVVELRERYATFAERRLPLLQKLGIA